ncbi:hypothetical protein DESUT3_30250 [Desulfuromonas versatilis]|uniref:Diguanylate cyclase/phosphodiesterase with PAS/PAC sensor(S) n=1 Tax=Desulfuromonas versatilis TaxID=2802975 RepID=A0ABN6E0R3_9BACT|nr:bifunctional diguanylate cyclase/phosphodiesterase [Desulfuromonas versatilis]BCR05956.1 hypothetical protein DESUT3_30250 [Desulfuromonas versatilis]
MNLKYDPTSSRDGKLDNSLLDSLAEASPHGVLLLDANGHAQLWNTPAEALLGWPAEEILGKPVNWLPAGSDREFEGRRQQAMTGKACCRMPLRAVHRSGRLVDLRATFTPVHTPAAESEGVMVLLETLSPPTQEDAARWEAEHLARATLDALPQHIAILDETGTIIAVNRAWREFAETNSTAPDLFCEGSNYLAVCDAIDEQQCPEAAAFAGGIRAVMQGTMLEFSLEYPCHSPVRPCWFMGRVTRFSDQGPMRIVVAHDNVTELMQAEKAIQQLAYYDLLTGLPNRLLLQDRLGQALAQAKREREMLAVLFLDLDRFKIINDTLGHAAGDRLLKTVAERLNACVRKSDTVARLGGDEFVVILPAVGHTEDPTLIAEKILHTLSRPFHLEGQKLFTSTSIGIAMYPADGPDAEALVKNADLAMYQAKEEGRNTFRFFSAELNDRAMSRLSMETALRRSLERGELELRFQEQTDLKSGRVCGVEALLRWRHPELGLLTPAEFLPLAEETGQIIVIGEWVLCAACNIALSWQRSGLPPVRITVNISSRQLRHYNLAQAVARILEETGLDPHWLELELTEDVLMQSGAEALERIRHLKANGVGLAIDDFGTGFSSLNLLKKAPVDRLKIDHSFIAELVSGPADTMVVRTIIDMAHNLGMKVIAEGVETEEQRDFLIGHGCDEVQGFHFHRPVTETEFRKLLESGALPQGRPS